MKLETNKVYDDINITPMLDLAWRAARDLHHPHDHGVRCRESRSACRRRGTGNELLQADDESLISITNDGRVFLDTFPVTMAEARVPTALVSAVTPEFPVVIKGDRTAQYGRIMEVLDICAKLGITQLGLVSERGRRRRSSRSMSAVTK